VASDEREAPKAEEVIPLEGIDTHSYLDDQMASNNWVIHGKHTKTGKPLLASDPHLGT
jgi:penicillin amidase